MSLLFNAPLVPESKVDMTRQLALRAIDVGVRGGVGGEVRGTMIYRGDVEQPGWRGGKNVIRDGWSRVRKYAGREDGQSGGVSDMRMG